MQTVVVDGQIVIEDGKSTRVDEDEVEAACLEQAKILWRKNGIDV